MKILWLSNVPIINSNDKAMNEQKYGGWMSSLAQEIIKIKDNKLISVFRSDKYVKEQIGNVTCYSFYYKKIKDEKLISIFYEILINEIPDIIQIWGTEYYHSLAMILAAQKAGIGKKVLVHIQGLISYYEKHYLLGIKEELIDKSLSLKDFILRRSMIGEKMKLKKRAIFEEYTIKNAQYVLGRTEWDKACTLQINPKCQYFHCEETLRNGFYSAKKWNIKDCIRNTIFISQGSYPIKGLHFLLEALNIVKSEIEDIKVYVGGVKPFKSYNKKFINSSYGNYVLSIIEKYDLKKNIVFLGEINENEIIDQYLKSHVFICPSTIENSSNSICEAMILGMPVIASYVGGNMTLIEDQIDGLLYQADAYYMLAYKIINILTDDNLAIKLGENAREKAEKRHNKEKIISNIIHIYKRISLEDKN